MIAEFKIGKDSKLVGRDVHEVCKEYGVHFLRLRKGIRGKV